MKSEGTTTAATMKSEGTTSSGSKVSRVMKAPYRALCRVRDLYVSILTGCAGNGSYRGVVGYPTGSSGVPRSYSFHSSRNSSCRREDDLKDLMQAASRQSPAKNLAGDAVVPRSQSVAIGRIDEDKACDFGMDATVGPLYPRSRSVAVVKRSVGVIA